MVRVVECDDDGHQLGADPHRGLCSCSAIQAEPMNSGMAHSARCSGVPSASAWCSMGCARSIARQDADDPVVREKACQPSGIEGGGEDQYDEEDVPGQNGVERRDLAEQKARCERQHHNRSSRC